MKIACLCPTYKRPRELAEAVACFLSQDYPADQRELIVLDDAGQYAPDALDGIPGVRLHTTAKRWPTLGEKRNETVRLASPNADVFAVWDDDDIYLPWHLSAGARALAETDAAYTIPTAIWVDKGLGRPLQLKQNSYLFHGAWMFRRELFNLVGGYPAEQSGQDQSLLRRFKAAKALRADPLQVNQRASYVYRWFQTHQNHFSALGTMGFEKLGRLRAEHVAAVVPAFSRDWVRVAGF